MTINELAKAAEKEVSMAAIVLDCYCDTCRRQITLDELQNEFHKDHHFSAIEMAALQAMRAYIQCCDPARKFQFPHS